jgi:predicted rRNA methylase YqxC with S4 and FtsJ domains
MTHPTIVYLNEDPYLTNLVVQLVTRNGQFMSRSEAKRLICQGAVLVNETPVVKADTILQPGDYSIRVGLSRYDTHVEHSARE